MITGELKNKIDSLWDVFAAGGLVNPLDVIEQITYLMFIRDLDDSDNLRAKETDLNRSLYYFTMIFNEIKNADLYRLQKLISQRRRHLPICNILLRKLQR